jgi:hypothetical protein
MSGYIESEAVFQQRCTEIGLTAAHHRLLCTANYSTMGKFAYSCNFVPGAADDTRLIETIDRVCGVHPDEGIVGIFRRLFFESFTMVQADLKMRLERSDEAPLRKLAVPERAARYAKQVAKLTSLVLTGQLECSDCLVDETIRQFDENRLKYIKWERCLMKDSEGDSVKKVNSIDHNSQGLLRLTTESVSGDADTSSELLLRFAMSRRGLAYDQANLIEYSFHEAWVTKLFTFRLREAPANHARISLEQVLNADKALFAKLCQLTRAGIIPTAAGVRPLDLVFTDTTKDPEVLLLLSNLPLASHSVAKVRALAQDETRLTKKQKQQLRAESKGQGKGSAKTDGKGNGGAKADGKGKRPPALPKGLEGSSVCPDGSKICFDYGLGKCDKPGSGCARGKHVCTLCFANHRFIDHPK